MEIKLPLDQMTAQEKMALIEVIWQDLSRRPEDVEFSERHQKILEERSAKLASGEEKFTDWETAKARIRAAASRHET